MVIDRGKGIREERIFYYWHEDIANKLSGFNEKEYFNNLSI